MLVYDGKYEYIGGRKFPNSHESKCENNVGMNVQLNSPRKSALFGGYGGGQPTYTNYQSAPFRSLLKGEE